MALCPEVFLASGTFLEAGTQTCGALLALLAVPCDGPVRLAMKQNSACPKNTPPLPWSQWGCDAAVEGAGHPAGVAGRRAPELEGAVLECELSPSHWPAVPHWPLLLPRPAPRGGSWPGHGNCGWPLWLIA